jgi:hypothetical protein
MSSTKTTYQLRAGDRIAMHGGVFLITSDARASLAHRPADNIGPSDVIAFNSVCESGNVPGYFWPGSSWTVQGNGRARWTVI